MNGNSQFSYSESVGALLRKSENIFLFACRQILSITYKKNSCRRVFAPLLIALWVAAGLVGADFYFLVPLFYYLLSNLSKLYIYYLIYNIKYKYPASFLSVFSFPWRKI
jgi:hypothetical protein